MNSTEKIDVAEPGAFFAAANAYIAADTKGDVEPLDELEPATARLVTAAIGPHPLYAAAPDLYREAVRVVEWLERLAVQAEARSTDTRFLTLAEANAADAKNYRASAKGLIAAIAKAEAHSVAEGSQR